MFEWFLFGLLLGLFVGVCIEKQHKEDEKTINKK